MISVLKVDAHRNKINILGRRFIIISNQGASLLLYLGVNYISRLYEISQKSERLIVGLMSGTSLDGLDLALCKISGSGLETSVELLEFETFVYQDAFRKDVQLVFSKKQVDLEKLCILNEVIASKHAEMILHCLQKWNVEKDAIDCIASHGQTIYHAPKRLHKLAEYPNASLQIGDGDHIAVKTGIITLCDFRQKNIAAGGEGAPLALYADALLFSSDQENRILLNIGGIANFTFIPLDGNPSKIISSDIGPGNTMINALTAKYYNAAFDNNGLIAAVGEVNNKLLSAMLEHSFFKDSLPKTVGPELFNLDFVNQSMAYEGISQVSPEDLIATLTRLTVEVIAKNVNNFEAPLTVYASGGGCHNPMIFNELKKAMPDVPLKTTKELGIDPDAKEAILFAILANETLSSSCLSIQNLPAVTMGKICLPG